MTLRITDLHFGYGRRKILHGVDLTAHKGELLGLLGPNGSGKSTVLKNIARIHTPTSGSFRWDETVALEDLRRRELARLVAYVPQTIDVSFELDVREAIVLGRTPHFAGRPTAEDWDHVDRAIELLGLGPLVGRSVTELSGGQAQRVLIARSLAQQPSILLLDEPTSALDIKYQLQTLRLARQITRTAQVAAIIAIHDLSQAARYCDRIAFLQDGHVLAVGTPEDVLTAERIEQMYGIEVSIIHANGSVQVIPRDEPDSTVALESATAAA
ncbi:ABC transporter ATP-binding protein [Rhodococcus jostii]|uniref:ABC transporter ATP-binding protein n=1 Tax=Rhodococcus jostii TaxID=132919 RepID=A0ABU4CRN0_RHOJO|nr:ABC transporter ATP-binding protein [Rhodococcus jostii]MDV6285850.1 ABC transporter ATP-binding protein [Rhodococcus jostii]